MPSNKENNKPNTPGPILRKCSRCGKMKPLDDFGNSKRYKYGKKSICKICEKEYNKEYRKTYGKGSHKSKNSFVSDQELIDKYVEFSEKHGYKNGAPMKVFVKQNEIYGYGIHMKRFGGLRKLKSVAYKDNFIIEVKKYCGVSSTDWRYYVNALSRLLDTSPIGLTEISKISGIRYNHIKDRLTGEAVPRLSTFIGITNAIGLRVDIITNTSHDHDSLKYWEYHIRVLEQLYKDNGLTLLEISKRTGIVYSHVSKFFSCKYVPQLDTFLNVANTLGATIQFTQPFRNTDNRNILEFNEEKAKEIVEKFGLSEKTIAVWRLRGKIPSKYADENYKPPVRIESNADKILTDRIVDIFSTEDINMKTIKELTGVTNLPDVVKGKSSFTKEQLIAIKKEINRLKIDVVKLTQTEYGFRKILSDKRLKHYVILRYSLNDNEIKTFMDQAQKSTFNKDLLMRAKDAFAVFALKLNL